MAEMIKPFKLIRLNFFANNKLYKIMTNILKNMIDKNNIIWYTS